MSGFTPGPWLRDGRTVYALNDKGHNRFFAGVQDAHTDEAELEANARLISAAPDMYEALLFVRDNVSMRALMVGYDKAGKPLHLDMLIDAALAKADGNEQQEQR